MLSSIREETLSFSLDVGRAARRRMMGCQSRRRRAGVEVCVAVVMLLFDAASSVRAVDFRTRVYLNADACRAVGSLSESQCANAYSNAKAEFNEKAPRFSTRAECERHFRRCMIGDISGGGKVTFIPAMRGFRIDSGGVYHALPVAEGDEADPLFQPRAVDRVDSYVSAKRTNDAQRAWQALIAPPPANATRGLPTVYDFGGPATSSSVIESYPVPPAMLQDLKTRMQKFGVEPN